MIYKKSDVKLGQIGEEKVKKYMEHLLNIELEYTEDFHPYDLFSKEKHLYIEVKTRRCRHNKHKTLYFSKAKLDFINENPTNKYIFVYNLLDGLFLWNFNKDQIFLSMGGRRDRGLNEIKKLCNIPVKYLIKIN
jgi:hypothetical protein